MTSPTRSARGAGPKPRVAITVGDPAGIGPEIALAAAASREVRAVCEPVLYGPHTADALATFAPGRISAEAGQASYDAIVAAVRDAQAGAVDAITTGPVHKEAFAACGLPWKGHTDLLGHLTGSRRVAMMFHSEPLRVVLATVHVAIAEVPRLLTRALVEDIVELTARSLPAFGYATPRIGLAGLNPHAGEHGLMGHEDDEVLAPAVAACRARGIDVQGPFPGDTVFLRATRGAFDVVVACYHDQGLIPVKLLAFGQSVNVTLGLPIIRTSVDHGTAFDIARQGTADASSMVSAVTLAAKLAGGGSGFRAHGSGLEAQGSEGPR
ncbi:4-hydroxythreonine-4-phosphate dehydrogenase [Luteitalea sp. TBR-22]|uniref:4-hydroxythreonine-4-phosphate dehydrogenase PdxA n=1 Tax=Luteitalea sp. TBR-22 TaxID=2802971 RepID=UPI001AF78285|nr:4-hydroxythreonine-4-phosphate dehydrogenase PdxA [Luteitalea sp. TBR-22]BCS34739.1 4-hydroxythreonine-4-phosphate dehydrogenase [Luteitalea sp. TBR-22]